jgi:membrane protein implicated in regulation of membrane protease activity
MTHNMWIALIFNLCVSLLFAGLLLRAFRRYETTSDRMVARLQSACEEEVQKSEEQHRDEKLRKSRIIDQAILDYSHATPGP